MTVQMNIAEAKAKLSELVARAEAGEEVIIARDGKPAVVLKPAVSAAVLGQSRRLGFLAHLGPLWEAPDAWEPDEEAADHLERGFGDKRPREGAPPESP